MARVAWLGLGVMGYTGGCFLIGGSVYVASSR